jgi:hypothetical protein
MNQVNQKELLAATGNIFKVKTCMDGNRRIPGPTYYIRAETALDAELKAKQRSRAKVATAFPWDPRREAVFGRYIVEVSR